MLALLPAGWLEPPAWTGGMTGWLGAVGWTGPWFGWGALPGSPEIFEIFSSSQAHLAETELCTETPTTLVRPSELSKNVRFLRLPEKIWHFSCKSCRIYILGEKLNSAIVVHFNILPSSHNCCYRVIILSTFNTSIHQEKKYFLNRFHISVLHFTDDLWENL